MAKKRRRLILKLAVLVGSTLFAILAVEGLLRVFMPHRLALPVGHHRLFCEYDPLLGWRKIPNFEGMHVTPEYAVPESMNSRGLRGPEYSHGKPEGVVRILVLGDSFAEGYSVPFERTFAEIARRMLNARGHRTYEMINAGTGGYSTDQALLFFQHEGKGYRPDLTILLVYFNDIWFNNRPAYRRGAKPWFRLRDGELTLTNVPVPKPEPRDAHGTEAPVARGPAQRIKRCLYERSYLYRLIQRTIKSRAGLHALAVKLGLADGSEGTEWDGVPIPDEYRIFMRESDAAAREAWDVTEAILARLREETRAIGSDLLVLSVPAQESIYAESATWLRRKYGFDDERWDLNRAADELGTRCARHRIPFVNPLAQFRTEAEASPDDRLYFPIDGHWTEAGHRLAGTILAEYVLGD